MKSHWEKWENEEIPNDSSYFIHFRLGPQTPSLHPRHLGHATGPKDALFNGFSWASTIQFLGVYHDMSYLFIYPLVI